MYEYNFSQIRESIKECKESFANHVENATYKEYEYSLYIINKDSLLLVSTQIFNLF